MSKSYGWKNLLHDGEAQRWMIFTLDIPALFLARLSSIVFTLLLLLPLLWPLFAAGAQPRWPLRAGLPLPASVE